jgi:NADH-quinone oxidoreductase subunit C
VDEQLTQVLAQTLGATPYPQGYIVPPERWQKTAACLKDEFGFLYLRDVTSVDWLEKRRPRRMDPAGPTEKRFDLIAQLTNIGTKESISLKTFLNEGEKVRSLVSLFPTAEFLEREIYDLMGIVFEGHPDLRRILLSDDWSGHPLRKDYPVSGYEMWDWEAHK